MTKTLKKSKFSIVKGNQMIMFNKNIKIEDQTPI